MAAGKLHEMRPLLIPGRSDEHPMLTQTVAWLLDVDPRMRIKLIGFRQQGVGAEARHRPQPDKTAASTPPAR